MAAADRIVDRLPYAFAVVRHDVGDAGIVQMAVQDDKRNSGLLDMVDERIVRIALAHDQNTVEAVWRNAL
ncbi:hypothetical protein D3C81_1198850 [compost metagenome]